jgi:hypothetical protein
MLAMEDKKKSIPILLMKDPVASFLMAMITLYIVKMASSIYISPHIEKVRLAGTNRFGYWSDNSPGVLLFIGRAVAIPLTTTVLKKPTRFIIDRII